MTNAFNLSQLANNTNSSGQVSLSTGTSGTLSLTTQVSGTLPVLSGGTGVTTKTGTGSVVLNTAPTFSGSVVIDTLKTSAGVLATQNGMTGIAKAWVKFNGSTVVVTSSFNVSSITRSSTGVFLVNFTTAMPDANYCTAGTANDNYVFITTYVGTSTTTQGVVNTYAAGSVANFSNTQVIFCGN